MYKPSQSVIDRHPSLSCASLVGTSEFEAKTLDAWARENGVRYVDYIKLDTQGSELDILRGALRVLETTRIIDLEVEFNPIYENQPLFSDVDFFLRSRGFVLWKFNTLVHYGTRGQKDAKPARMRVAFDDHDETVVLRGGQLYWADARYIKSDMLDQSGGSHFLHRLERDARLAEVIHVEDLHLAIRSAIDSRSGE
jgi:hypothetical protein